MESSITSEFNNEYADKYYKLFRKYESIKSENERFINHICQIKLLIHKYKCQRRALIKRLEKHKDDYRNVNVPLFMERDESVPSNVSKSVNTSHNKSSIANKSKRSKSCDNKTDCKSGILTHQNAPKKPINPYLIFCQENRTSLQEKYQQQNNAELSHQELTKSLAHNWHELSVGEKQVYYSLYEQEKERYESKMKAFISPNNKLEKELESSEKS